MSSLQNSATTIAISRQNRQTLSDFGKKGQSFDEILTKVLNIATEYQENEKEGSQPKVRVDRSALVAGYVPSIRTAEVCDSIP